MKFSKPAIVALGASLFVVPLVSAQTKAPDAQSRTFKQFSVVIDAGHGGHDSGDATGKIAEKDVTLSLALKLRAALEQQGIQVVLTRPRNDFLPLQERVDIVNKIHPDCLISLHGARQTKPFSFLVNYYTPASTQLAQTLSRDLAKNLHLPGQPQATIQRYFIVRKSTVPAVMVTGDLSTLTTSEEQQNFVAALAGGVEDYARNVMADNQAALDKAKLENERKLEAQHQQNKLSAERYRAQQEQMARIKEMLEAQRQAAKASEQLAKERQQQTASKKALQQAQSRIAIAQAFLHKTQPKSSPMLRKPEGDHTYPMPNALKSLPNQPEPTTMARKPGGPYNFLGTTKP